MKHLISALEQISRQDVFFRLAAVLVAKCRCGTKVVVFVDDLVDHLHPRRGRVCRHPSIPQVVAVERPGSCGVYQRTARDAFNPGWQPVRSVPSMWVWDVIKSELRTAVSTYDLLNVKRELLSGGVAFTCALLEKNADGVLRSRREHHPISVLEFQTSKQANKQLPVRTSYRSRPCLAMLVGRESNTPTL